MLLFSTRKSGRGWYGRLVGTFHHALVNSQDDGLACAVSVRAVLVNKKKHGVVINLVFCLMDGQDLVGKETCREWTKDLRININDLRTNDRRTMD